MNSFGSLTSNLYNSLFQHAVCTAFVKFFIVCKTNILKKNVTYRMIHKITNDYNNLHLLFKLKFEIPKIRQDPYQIYIFVLAKDRIKRYQHA